MPEEESLNDREKVANAVVNLLDEEGSKTTAELRESLYSDFENLYENESSFHRTLNYLREEMVRDGEIETLRVPGEGSRKTWEWRVADQ